MAVLDQSTVAVLDQSGFAAFGHGTMVAGIVHLVAPTSQIMPLKAFGPDGTGFTSDIIRAVYFAVPQVNALNMSFSMPQPSAELGNALDYAAAQSVVSVAAAGNDGTARVVYPAGFQNDVMGVGLEWRIRRANLRPFLLGLKLGSQKARDEIRVADLRRARSDTEAPGLLRLSSARLPARLYSSNGLTECRECRFTAQQ